VRKSFHLGKTRNCTGFDTSNTQTTVRANSDRPSKSEWQTSLRCDRKRKLAGQAFIGFNDPCWSYGGAFALTARRSMAPWSESCGFFKKGGCPCL
jgi:hypothetical protein